MQNKLLIIIIIAVAFGLRLFYLSPWLDDWDSIQFALGLHQYSLSLQQPHAPGYPLYILLGKFFYIFLQNDTRALTFLSALSGSLATIPLYLLAKKMFNAKTAIIASLFFIITPLEWILSEAALTNIPGLLFLLIFAYLLYIKGNTPKRLVYLSAFGGLILGVRFTEVPVIVVLLTLSHIKYSRPKYIIFSLLSFLGGIALWVIPIIALSGTRQFLNAYGWIAGYILVHDAQLKQVSPFLNLFRVRLPQLWYLFKVGYTPYLILTGTLAGLWFFTDKKNWPDFKLQFLGVWVLAYAIPLAFVYNLEVPRYTLPLLPPLVIFSSALLSRWINKPSVLILIPSLLAALLFLQSFSQVNRFHNMVPPTIQPVQFVKENFDPAKTIIIATFTYRQFQYYAPEFPVYYGDKITRIAPPTGDKVIIDYPGLKDKIINEENFQVTLSKEFNGDQDIYTRIPKTYLFVLSEQ